MTDWATDVQQKAEAHLAACNEALYEESGGDLNAVSPASAPFCGCDTCVVREVLTIAWSELEAGIAASTRELMAEYAAEVLREALKRDRSHRDVVETVRAAVLAGPPEPCGRCGGEFGAGGHGPGFCIDRRATA